MRNASLGSLSNIFMLGISMPPTFISTALDILFSLANYPNVVSQKRKGLITLCVVSLTFFIFLAFSCIFTWFLIPTFGIQNARKMQDKRKKHKKNASQTQDKFLYYTMHWVKTLLVVFFIAFWNVWDYQNTNPTHSVLWALLMPRDK